MSETVKCCLVLLSLVEGTRQKLKINPFLLGQGNPVLAMEQLNACEEWILIQLRKERAGE